MKRKKSKNLLNELYELDYLKSLSEKDREWMTQFMFEYYQADFNFETPIHPKELRKDCMNRNNASKRQMHSVGPDILDEAASRARASQNAKMTVNRKKYYTPEDYSKDLNEVSSYELNESDFEQI